MVYRVLILTLMAGFMVVSLPSEVQARLECHAKRPPKINVLPVKSRIKYDFTKSKQDLNARDVDTISPYGPQHTVNVSGLMSGAIQLKSNVSFMHETYKFLGRGCVFLGGVEVEIHLEPTIYIASDFPQGSCMHNAVLAHEFKHVEADQRIVNKYTNLIGLALEDAIERQGQVYGPMKIDQMEGIQIQVKNAIQRVVVEMNDELNEERRRDQQAIDNIHEYRAVGERCKGRDRRDHRW